MKKKLNIVKAKGLKFFVREDTWDDNVIKFEVEQNCYENNTYKTVIDIGAHIGGTAILSASKGATVYAYEPSKENFELLQKNIKLNDLNIKAFNCGVGKAGKRKLYLDDNNYGQFTLTKGNKGSNGKYEMVDIISIQEVFKDIDHCDFLKIDCEGAEVEFVFDLSLDKIDKIAIEFHNNEKDQEIINFLLDKYYITKIINDELLILEKFI